jgi:SET domain-containing protein
MSYQALPKELHIQDSPIAGQGLFAKEDIPVGTYLGMSHLIVDDIIYRTPLGGFINHSDDPNCLKYYEDGSYFIRTKDAIKTGEELFLEYTFYKITKDQ